MATTIADLRAVFTFDVAGGEKLKTGLKDLEQQVARVDSLMGPNGGRNQYTQQAQTLAQNLVNAATRVGEVERKIIDAANAVKGLGDTSSQRFEVMNLTLGTTVGLMNDLTNAVAKGQRGAYAAFGTEALKELGWMNDIVARRRELLPLAEAYARNMERAAKFTPGPGAFGGAGLVGVGAGTLGSAVLGPAAGLAIGTGLAGSLAAYLARNKSIGDAARKAGEEAGTQFAELYRRQVEALVTRTPLPSVGATLPAAAAAGTAAGDSYVSQFVQRVRANLPRQLSGGGVGGGIGGGGGAGGGGGGGAPPGPPPMPPNFNQWGAGLQNLYALSAALYGPLGQLVNRLASLQYGFQTLGGNTLAVGVAASAATAGLFKFTSEAIRVERVLGPVRELHIALAKTVGQDGVKNFEMLTEVMQKYGLSLEYLSKPIARLKIATDGTVLGGERFRGFLEDFAAVSSKFALPQEAISGMAKAFEQMISKGTVQAEEFRQQLGDRLPAAARVGLVTFQELTGNASASFSDFMNAMKNRQLESTRFLDVFMIKLKEMFSITNDATNNLNSAYGRLATNRDVMISKLDQAVGLTKTWTVGLNALSSAMYGVGKSAEFVAPVMALAVGAGAMLGVARLGGVLTTFAGSVGLVGQAVTGLRVAMGVLGTVGLAVFGTQLYGAGQKFLESIGAIQAKVAGFQGGPLTKELFQVRVGFDKDPTTLISEISGYLVHVKEGLKQGKKVELDPNIDFVGAIDKALEGLKSRTEGVSEMVPTFFKNGKFKEYVRSYSEEVEGVITLDRVLTARLNKQSSEALNARVLNEKDVWARADMAAQLRSAATAAREIQANKASMERLEQLKTRFIATQQQMAGVATQTVGGSGGGWLDGMISGAARLMPLLTNVASVLGAIAAANLLGLATGFGRVGDVVATLGGRLGSVYARLGLIVAIAGVLTVLSSGANAAEVSVKSLIERAGEVKGEVSKAGEAGFNSFGKLSEVVGDAKTKLDELRTKAAALRSEIDSKKGGALDSNVLPDKGSIWEQLYNATPWRSTGSLKAELDTVNAAIVELKKAVEDLAPVQAKMAEEAKKAGKALDDEGSGGLTLADRLKTVQSAIDDTRVKMETLRSGGIGALRTSDAFDELLKQYADGIGDIGAKAQASNPQLKEFIDKLKELGAAQAALTGAKKDAEAAEKRSTKNNVGADEGFSKAQSIIAKADSVMEGSGLKIANLIKKNTDEQRNYFMALRDTGVGYEEAAQKAELYRKALDMQVAGVNLATLQMQPLAAMQRGLESFSSSIADLMVNGKANSKSFAEAFKTMARSIIKDIIDMSIKATIIKPLLSGLFNLGGGGGGGGGDSINAASWLAGTTTTKFANGGIPDGPTVFPMGGGKSGVMGEAGSEAVMPLTRDSSGRLGVSAVGGAGGGVITIVVHTTPELDARITSTAENVVVQRAPAIVGASVEATRQSLPSMIDGAQKRSM